ncbi:hypothetical protein VNO78_32986 [Psophocarpus tetragonolobus]|uniref:Uncharacterized protein n=1 Tax=Psophocarpus tetragonolobus TaxID=3891 RepID=A0AAN9NW50_PSOTE
MRMIMKWDMGRDQWLNQVGTWGWGAEFEVWVGLSDRSWDTWLPKSESFFVAIAADNNFRTSLALRYRVCVLF